MSVTNPAKFLRALRSRAFDFKVSRFDVKPFILQQRAAFAANGLDFDAAHEAVTAFFGNRADLRADTSQHWEVAAAVILTGRVKKVLEIGTERGEFTAFLHSLRPELEITSVDLPQDDSRYINATTDTRVDVTSTDSAITSTTNERRKNIGRLHNVRFWEMNSVRLSTVDEKFDFVYVDGDHTFPIVAIDATNAVRLTSPDGWILFDDLISDRRVASEYGGSESTKIVAVLEQNAVISVTRFHKRLEAAKLFNEHERKHIALAKPQR